KQARPGKKEAFKFTEVLTRQHSEARQGRALVSIERRRDPPDASTPLPQFVLFSLAIFDQAVRRISYDCLHTIRRRFRQPVEAIAMNKRRVAKAKCFTRQSHSGDLRAPSGCRLCTVCEAERRLCFFSNDIMSTI